MRHRYKLKLTYTGQEYRNVDPFIQDIKRKKMKLPKKV